MAIDRFGAGTVSCPEYLEKGDGGFFILCNDFVRMANAYTTSLQSPAALASLVTGEYPLNHELRHPDSFLSFKNPTLAQILLTEDYRTGFFSEGDPVKSYQGLNRGFETFYDFSTSTGQDGLKQVFKSATNFIMENKTQHLSLIYVSSLKKLEDGGDVVDALEIHLSELFDKLKKNKKWHNTHILIVGLQGSLKQSVGNKWPIVNLNEKNIKVEAFYKPATKPRDSELSFQIDRNITLADLGHTLINSADPNLAKKGYNQKLPELTSPKSLESYFKKKSETTMNSSPVMIESSWPDWRYGYAPIYSILDDQYRVFLNKDIKVFNTLLNQEMPLAESDQITDERKYFYLATASKLNSEGKDQFKDSDIDKFALGYKIWGVKDYKYPDILTELEAVTKSELESSFEIDNWMAKLSVLHQDCKKLLELAVRNKNKKWELAAKSCLNIKTSFTNDYRIGCLRVFFKKIKTWSNQCQNDLLYHAWKYISFEQSDAQFNNFKTYYKQYAINNDRIQNNWKTFLSSALAYETAIEPTDFELYYLQLSDRQKNLIDQAKSPH